MTDHRADAARLLSHLWKWLDDGFVELRPIGASGPMRGGRRWLSLEDACKTLPQLLDEYNRRGVHAYYGVLPRTTRGGGEGDVGEGAVVWVDLDTRPPDAKKHAMTPALADKARNEARRRLANVPWNPSAVVLTGGGAHAYWRLSEPTPAAVCAELSLRMSAAVGGDPNACDVARILRLPGSLNHKYTPAYPVRLWHLDDDNMGLDADDLDDLLPPIAIATARRSRGGRPRRTGSALAHPDTQAIDRAASDLVWLVRQREGLETDLSGRATMLDAIAESRDPLIELTRAGRALGARIHAPMGEAVAAVKRAGLLSTEDRPTLSTATDTVRHIGRGVLHGAIPATIGRRLTPPEWVRLLDTLARCEPGERRRRAFRVGARLGSTVASDALALLSAAVEGHGLSRPEAVGALVTGIAVGSRWASKR